jgi:hypothetical protein
MGECSAGGVVLNETLQFLAFDDTQPIIDCVGDGPLFNITATDNSLNTNKLSRPLLTLVGLTIINARSRNSGAVVHAVDADVHISDCSFHNHTSLASGVATL